MTEGPRAKPDYRISFDIGGTFTDLVILDGGTGTLRVTKVPTVPQNPAEAVARGVRRLLEMQGIAAGAIGYAVAGATTLVTNTLIEGKGARTGLITTLGFADVLEIGREIRYDVYENSPKMLPPLVPRPLRKEVGERLDKDGRVLVPLNRAEALAVLEELGAAGVEAIAVCLLHAYANPAHERAIGALIAERLPGVAFTLSSDLLPQIREYERTVNTALNAYLQPVLSDHLTGLAQTIQGLGVPAPLYMMHGSGGVISLETAAGFPLKLLESGPAAGALAAVFYGQLTGTPNLLSLDMGGTTAKACLIEGGRPRVAMEFEAARVDRFKRGSGYPIRLPAIDLMEIGAGGGSIARVDAMGLLKVGPQSAGAEPGPACYGHGGQEPTVTDADLVMGYLNPDYFLGGELPLDRQAGERAIGRRLAAPLGLSLIEAAAGIYRVVNENMATAARVHIAEHGKDPRNYTLIAFGGAGPGHARDVARRLGIRRVLVPRSAGALSAIGLLIAPPVMDFVRSYVTPVEQIDWEFLESMFAEMAAQGVEALKRVGADPAQITLERAADMRYVGQGRELTVELPAELLAARRPEGLVTAFSATYQRLFNRRLTDVPVEALNWRLVVSAPAPRVSLGQRTAHGASLADARKKPRQAYFPEVQGFLETAVYDHDRLFPGVTFEGPAIIEQRESTTVVGSGERVSVDPYLNLAIDLNGGRPG
jgi:N-methylhydantoinase A